MLREWQEDLLLLVRALARCHLSLTNTCACFENAKNWLRIPKPYTGNEDEGNDKASDTDDISKSKQMVATAKEKAELGWRFKFRHVVGVSKYSLLLVN